MEREKKEKEAAEMRRRVRHIKFCHLLCADREEIAISFIASVSLASNAKSNNTLTLNILPSMGSLHKGQGRGTIYIAGNIGGNYRKFGS